MTKKSQVTRIQLQNSYPAVTVDPARMSQLLATEGGSPATVTIAQDRSTHTRFLITISWESRDGQTQTVSDPTWTGAWWSAAVRHRETFNEIKRRLTEVPEPDRQPSLL